MINIRNTSILLITIFCFSCSNANKMRFPIKEDIYEFKYPSNWKGSYYPEEYDDKNEYIPPYASIGIFSKNDKVTSLNGSTYIGTSSGSVYIFTEKTNNCPPIYLDEKDSSDLNEEDEEGPEFTPIYKKDKVLINNKMMDRWYNKKNIHILQIFSKEDNGQCMMFEMRYFRPEDKDVVSSFYEIIKSFHKVKDNNSHK